MRKSRFTEEQIRLAVVPPPAEDTEDCDHDDQPATGRPAPRPRNDSWAELTQRVFAIDVLERPSSGERNQWTKSGC